MRTVKQELRADSKESLEKKVEHYKLMFHPFGYGTYLASEYYDEEDARYVAVMKRQESCD